MTLTTLMETLALMKKADENYALEKAREQEFKMISKRNSKMSKKDLEYIDNLDLDNLELKKLLLQRRKLRLIMFHKRAHLRTLIKRSCGSITKRY
jgi:ribosome biogenesis protein Nip4